MSLIGALLRGGPRAAYGSSTTLGTSGGWLERLVAPRTKSTVTVSEFTAINLPAVYAAVSLIADTVAQLPLQLFRRTATGRVPATEHPLWRVLHDAPNERMTAFTFRETAQSHCLLWGNGYAEIERDGAERARGLWPLLPDRTVPELPSPDAEVRYRTTIGGRQFAIPASNVLHIPALGFDGLVGYSPIRVAREAIGLGLAMEEFGAKFFANDAKSGGFVYHPGRLSPKAKENVRQSVEEQGGLDNAHRVKVLEEGARFVPTTIPPEDAQFLGSREFQIAEVARIFRVPLILLESHEKSTSWGTGIEQLMLGFVRFTIVPWLCRWESELNRKLFTEAERAAGYFVKHNVNALLRGDMESRGQFYRTMFEIAALKPAEIRALEDMDATDGVDAFFHASNVQRADAPPPKETVQ